MIHLCFQPADAEVLQKAAELEPSGPLTGEYLVIEDDFSVGPLRNMYEPDGFQSRKNWWKELLTGTPYTEQIHLVDDKLKVFHLLKKLDAGEELWIWMGQNAHDVMGYYWLLPQLSHYQGQVWILYLNNLPFFNEKGGLFYPSYLCQIPPAEFLKARKLARKITASEFEVDGEESARIMHSDSMVRILEGGKKLALMPENKVDQDLLQILKSGPLKWAKFYQLYNARKTYLSDVFIFWRVRQLADEGTLLLTFQPNKDWKEAMLSLPIETIPES